MEEYYKVGHEKLKQLVYAHHDAIIQLIQLLKKREEREAEFWKRLQKSLKEVK